jgi:YbgC/YbaW family acyl-CoA thioester hydrolase
MPRTRLTLPSHFTFNALIPVRVTDLNYGGHVGNDSILSIIHEARMQFLKHFGLSELQFAGTGLIMSDVTIEFLAEAFYGDMLEVGVAATDFTRAGFTLYYAIAKRLGDTKVAVANAKTGMVCYDYARKKVSAVPPHIPGLLAS